MERLVSPSLPIDTTGSDSPDGRGSSSKGGTDEATHDGPDEITTHEEEVQPMRVMPTPHTPTASELAEHRISHMPYRSWCSECVEAFGREAPHKSTEALRASWTPVISCDYLYVSARGVFNRHDWQPAEDEQTKHLKVLVI